MGELKKYFKIVAIVAVAYIIIAAAFPEIAKAAEGFKKDKKGTYYVMKNGKRANGLCEIKGNLYLFTNTYLFTGWQIGPKGEALRYFNPFADGRAAKGWVTGENGFKRFFDKKTGLCRRGWLKSNGKYLYFDKKTGVMATGWVKIASGKYRYFNKKTGVMATGWVKNSEGYRYFDKKTGVMYIGWVRTKNGNYYFQSNGLAYINRFATVKGQLYWFNGKGIAE